jgi:hypothetical protein
MFDDGGKPRIGIKWGELGVRPPGASFPDVDVEPNGTVTLNNKGMSVFRSLADLKSSVPARLVPLHLWEKIRGAAGAPAKGHPAGTRIWSMGSASFAPGPLAPDLVLYAPGGSHGTVCPDHVMLLADFQKALADTRDSWNIDEPP